MSDDHIEKLSKRIEKLESQNLKIMDVIQVLNKSFRSAYINMEKMIEEYEDDFSTVISDDAKQSIQDELLKLQEDKVEKKIEQSNTSDEKQNTLEQALAELESVDQSLEEIASEEVVQKTEEESPEGDFDVEEIKEVLASQLNKPDVQSQIEESIKSNDVESEEQVEEVKLEEKMASIEEEKEVEKLEDEIKTELQPEPSTQDTITPMDSAAEEIKTETAPEPEEKLEEKTEENKGENNVG